MNQLTETEKAYLAGFFDGDGCVNIAIRQSKCHATPSHYLQVIFSQCNEEFLTRWRNKVDIGSIHKNTRLTNLHATKELWHWRVYDRQAEAILLMMRDYLDIKQKQADIALKFMQTKGKGGPHATPTGILRLREHYKQQLHRAKRDVGSLIDAEQDITRLEIALNSQLRLFTIENN